MNGFDGHGLTTNVVRTYAHPHYKCDEDVRTPSHPELEGRGGEKEGKRKGSSIPLNHLGLCRSVGNACARNATGLGSFA